MNSPLFEEFSTKNDGFWNNATKYASSENEDEPFVSELAYVMVTLHRTGN